MLNLSSSANEIELRNALVECGRLMYQRKLITSTDGNFSVRLSNGNILITPAGIAKGRMNPDDMLIVNVDGDVISSRADRKPSSETAMHLEVYKHRENIHAVIHAHPVFSTTITVAHLEFPNDVLPEVMATLGSVPITEYATPSSHEDA
ncbi:MAG: class II aldolase/adducin family protein, partial [Anaerolineales bacterium]